MNQVSIEEMLKAGVHFGHQTQRWNPKMKPFIYTARNKLYIIDLKKTKNKLEEASNAIGSLVSKRKKVMFVGTKKQAKYIIKAEAQRVGEYFVTERWLGGMLTNFKTIKKNLERLYKIEEMFEDGSVNRLPKKEIIQLNKKKEKLLTVLGGIKGMETLPAAVFVVDPKKERIAVAEANKLGIPVFAIIDTNCDPDPIDYPIPANDDAIRSISLIVNHICETIAESKAMLKDEMDEENSDLEMMDSYSTDEVGADKEEFSDEDE